MKTLIKTSLYIIVTVFLFVKCTKKETDNVSTVMPAPDSIGVSLLGDPYILTPLGGALPTDQGAEVYHSTLGTFTIYASNLDKINTSQSGIQLLEYKYRDPNGFYPKDPYDANAGTVPLPPVTRSLIIPYNVANPIDFVGNYKRVPQNTIMKITKLLDGVHLVENFGGVAPPNTIAYYQAILIQKSEDDFEMIPIGGGAGLTIDLVTITPTTIKLKVLGGGGFGANERTFNKM